jgi:hypothetical protein
LSSLEQFARIRAAIERGGDRERVLRGEGIAPAAWLALQRRWLDALAVEITRGGGELAGQYLRAFEGALPGNDTSASSAEPARPVTPSPPPPAVLPAPLEASPRPPAPAAPPPAPEAPPVVVPLAQRGTAMAFEAPIRPAIPFRAGPSSLPSASEARAADAPTRIPSGTSLAVETPLHAATPFEHDAGAPSPAPAPRAPAAHPGSGTALAPAGPAGPATPFQPLEPEALGFTLPRYAELVAERDESGAALSDVLAMFEIDAAQHAQIESFWSRKFSANGLLGLELGRLVGLARKALKERRASRAAAPSAARATVALEARQGAAHEAKPSPSAPAAVDPAAPGGAPVPELSVEQYAWVVATLRRTSPEQIPAALARFRLTSETKRELESRWSKRMASDPALQQAFLAHLARYLGGGPR